jgi:hypothetical protein
MENKYSREEIEEVLKLLVVPRPKKMLRLPVEPSKKDYEDAHKMLIKDFFNKLKQVRSEKICR